MRKEKILAVVTARGGSKRIPRKNIKSFCGAPIIKYSIQAAIKSKIFDEVMVSTDDQEIADTAVSYGAKFPFWRSKKNSDDHAMTAEVIIEVIEEYEKKGMNFDYVCCLYPTAPFVTSEKLKQAFELLKNRKGDSIFPIVKFSYPPQRALHVKNNLMKMLWPKNYNRRSQDLEPIYHDCGQFYFLKVKSLLKGKILYLKKTISFEISDLEAQDIDNEDDWKIAELKYKTLLSR